MKKKVIISIGIVLGIIIVVLIGITQISKWSKVSFEAVVQEVTRQSDSEVRLIIERTTEVYGDPKNSLGISNKTKLLDHNGNKMTIDNLTPGTEVKVTLKDAFTEETPFYYPKIYEIKVIGDR